MAIPQVPRIDLSSMMGTSTPRASSNFQARPKVETSKYLISKLKSGADYLKNRSSASPSATSPNNPTMQPFSGSTGGIKGILGNTRNTLSSGVGGMMNPVTQTPAAQTYMSGQVAIPTQGDMQGPVYKPTATGIPAIPAIPAAKDNFGASPYIDLKNVYGTINGKDYNAAGEWMNNNVTKGRPTNPAVTRGATTQTSSTGQNTGTTAPTTPTGNTVVNATNNPTSPDRQAYIDAYKKYIEAQTNSADVQNAKTAYNDFLANQAKSVAGLEGRGLGTPLSIVRGEQAKLKGQTDPELARLQNAIGIAQTGQTNTTNAYKTGVDMQKSLLDFGQQDSNNARADRTENRLNNPNFNLGEGQVNYSYDDKTGKYVKTVGPAKTYAPKTSTETSAERTQTKAQDIGKLAARAINLVKTKGWAGMDETQYNNEISALLTAYGPAAAQEYASALSAQGIYVDNARNRADGLVGGK